jgi:hypothetical protein
MHAYVVEDFKWILINLGEFRANHKRLYKQTTSQT